MSAEQLEWLAIGAMGVVTFSSRVLGVSLARWIPRTPKWDRFMHVLPGTLLVSIIAPYFASGSGTLTAAAAITLFVAARGSHLVISMAVGVGCVALLRAFA
jgi:uncharacterized membrane protein